jgi:hypothetical protein
MSRPIAYMKKNIGNMHNRGVQGPVGDVSRIRGGRRSV